MAGTGESIEGEPRTAGKGRLRWEASLRPAGPRLITCNLLSVHGPAFLLPSVGHDGRRAVFL